MECGFMVICTCDVYNREWLLQKWTLGGGCVFLLYKNTNSTPDTIMEKKHDITATEAQKKYPGAEIDKADKDKVDSRLVKEETKDLNNNPRNNDIDN